MSKYLWTYHFCCFHCVFHVFFVSFKLVNGNPSWPGLHRKRDLKLEGLPRQIKVKRNVDMINISEFILCVCVTNDCYRMTKLSSHKVVLFTHILAQIIFVCDGESMEKTQRASFPEGFFPPSQIQLGAPPYTQWNANICIITRQTVDTFSWSSLPSDSVGLRQPPLRMRSRRGCSSAVVSVEFLATSRSVNRRTTVVHARFPQCLEDIFDGKGERCGNTGATLGELYVLVSMDSWSWTVRVIQNWRERSLR